MGNVTNGIKWTGKQLDDDGLHCGNMRKLVYLVDHVERWGNYCMWCVMWKHEFHPRLHNQSLLVDVGWFCCGWRSHNLPWQHVPVLGCPQDEKAYLWTSPVSTLLALPSVLPPGNTVNSLAPSHPTGRDWEAAVKPPLKSSLLQGSWAHITQSLLSGQATQIPASWWASADHTPVCSCPPCTRGPTSGLTSLILLNALLLAHLSECFSASAACWCFAHRVFCSTLWWWIPRLTPN